jgi:hypothetical protein
MQTSCSDTPKFAAASALLQPSTMTRWTMSARRATVIVRFLVAEVFMFG